MASLVVQIWLVFSLRFSSVPGNQSKSIKGGSLIETTFRLCTAAEGESAEVENGESRKKR